MKIDRPTATPAKPRPIAAAAALFLSAALIAAASDAQLFAQRRNAGPSASATATKEAKTTDDGLSPSERLVRQQRELAEKYKRLESILLRMAELESQSDPRRAALLRKAVAQSKERLIDVRFERLVELLGKEQLSRALENQGELDQDLQSILELLMSENRDKSLENEKARIREYLKQLGVLIRQQREVHGRTLSGDEPKRLADEQNKITDQTGKLSDAIKKHEEKGGSQKSGDGRKASGNDSKQSGGDGKKSDGDGKKQDGGEKGGKASGDSQKGNDGDSASGGEDKKDNGQNSQSSPARKRLDQAKQRMQDAEAKLQKSRQQGAAEDQEKAIKELEQAKAELENILRQLREEEVARLLAALEVRFKKMLQMQTEVYESTRRLDRVPTPERTHSHEIEASRLSSRESAIVVEVDKAMLLLKEDGTSAAFPEAVGQMREDMLHIVGRLSQMKVGRITQDIELDVIAALKEMIEALKKAQKEQENNRKASKQQPSAGNQESALIDQLAELKMIRTLQLRVNTRTARYSKMIEGEQAESEELIEAIRRLGERQERIHRVTRDLQMGKNQ